MNKLLILSILANLGLTGCVVAEHPGHTDVYYPEVEHHDRYYRTYDEERPYHCPPGQHKKGRC